MIEKNIEIVIDSLEKYGDGFWSDTNIEEDDEILIPNSHLFKEILEVLNKIGLDLELIKKE